MLFGAFLLYLFDSHCLDRSGLRRTPNGVLLLSGVAFRGASTRVGGGSRRRRVPLLWVALRLRGVALGWVTLGWITLGCVALGRKALGWVALRWVAGRGTRRRVRVRPNGLLWVHLGAEAKPAGGRGAARDREAATLRWIRRHAVGIWVRVLEPAEKRKKAGIRDS
jgi:hypothetical protein